MTLIETMVTIGIASGLILAVMEAVNLTTRQMKNAQISEDWTASIDALRYLTQNGPQCTSNFSGLTFSGTWLTYPTNTSGSTTNAVYCNGAPSGWAAGSKTCTSTAGPNKLGPVNSSGVMTPIVDTTAPVGNIRAGLISVSPVTGDTTQVILSPYLGSVSMPSGVYEYVDTYELEIEATKVAVSGSGLPGGNTQLYIGPGFNHSNAVTFQMVRGPSGNVVSCYQSTDQAQRACNSIGGVYGPAGTQPRCQLENLQLGVGGVYGPPANVGTPSGQANGEKVALWRGDGAWGSPSNLDFSIGIDSNTVWFNAGGGTKGGYAWYNTAGANTQAQLSDFLGGQILPGLWVSNGSVVASTTTDVPAVVGLPWGPSGSPTTAHAPIHGSVVSTAGNNAYGFIQSEIGTNWFRGGTWFDRTMIIGNDGQTLPTVTQDINDTQYYGYKGNEYVNSYPYYWELVAANQELHSSTQETHFVTNDFHFGYLYWDMNWESTYQAKYNYYDPGALFGATPGYISWEGTDVHYGTAQLTGPSALIYFDNSETNQIVLSQAGSWSVQSTVYFDNQFYVGNGNPIGTRNGFLNIVSGSGQGGNVPHNCSWHMNGFTGTTTATCPYGYAVSGGCQCSAGGLIEQDASNFNGPSPNWWCWCNSSVAGNVYYICCDI